jgi:protein AroM
MTRLIAAVTIGQAPRPDLLEPLMARLPADVAVIEVGALDPLDSDDLPKGGVGAYPLTTQLRDGRPATLDEAFLAPLVQAAVDEAERRGATTTLLLCAGGFPHIRARGVLVRPFDAAAAELRTRGAVRIVVAVPIDGQIAPSERKWRAAGFDPVVIVGSPPALDAPAGISAVVLDYVGHPVADVAALQAALTVPLIDLGEAGASATAARFR